MDSMEIFIKCQICGKENVLVIHKGNPEKSNCSNCGKLIISYTPVNGYVYILSNSKMPKLLKIVFTRRSYEDRIVELNAETGVPAPFIPEVIFYSENPSDHEKILHERLSAYRVEQKAVTFDTLAKRLVGTDDTGFKKDRKPRAKRVLTPEEKAAFHARMVAGRLAKEKSLASKK